VNRAEQAALAVILWEQGVAGSNPAVPTTHAKPLVSQGSGTPSLGYFEQVVSSQPLTEILMSGRIPSSRPSAAHSRPLAAVARPGSAAEAHVPERSFRRTLEQENSARGPSRPTPTRSSSSSSTARNTICPPFGPTWSDGSATKPSNDIDALAMTLPMAVACSCAPACLHPGRRCRRSGSDTPGGSRNGCMTARVDPTTRLARGEYGNGEGGFPPICHPAASRRPTRCRELGNPGALLPRS
jgi:hypothetical protein